jgi:hypothetical protein
MKKLLSDDQLLEAFNSATQVNQNVTSEELKAFVKSMFAVDIDSATIRGRLIQMGKPLSGKSAPTPTPTADTPVEYKAGDKVFVHPDIASITDEEPHLTKLMTAMANKELTVDYVNNKGFIGVVGMREMWHTKWLVKELPKPTIKQRTLVANTHVIEPELQAFIPKETDFKGYVERDTDKRLALHLDLGKHPIAQGKQGTGKTFSFPYYAYKRGLPFFLFSCYEDFKLPKLFGDKTIVNGTIKFQESLFVKAIQSPSVVLFDEVNAISQANTFDFHAMLQNRQLFIKDANDGAGKVYQLHPDCKVGFAQNPKSAKYIGGQVRASNFLGRCTYITYPEFTQGQLEKAVSTRYPELPKLEVKNFVKFYIGCTKAIEQSQIPFDISIRQLFNVIDLHIHGATLEEAIDGGLTSIAEAASHPKSKEALTLLSHAVWAELMKK